MKRDQRKGRKLAADYGGLSQYEIAERLGISRARVSQIEARAMRKLRAAAAKAGWR